ncbi:ABC transporter ATP-binding protein [Candidatus Collierbacteria bacterium]|nr:ABC transporter ATP-binding protein [Candidatus Collierbacteria bacterium]
MPKRNNLKPLLSLKAVSKTYFLEDNASTILKDINLEIFKGEFVSILGPSGSGKSTLMHIASFLDKPSTGEVYFNSTRLTSLSENQLADIRNRSIGFVFQQFNLLERSSSLENVQLPLVYSQTSPTLRFQRARELLEKVGLKDRLNHRPNQLSGGQQQRVAIARALVNDPEIIFADEPTGNLDSKSGNEIMSLLTSLNQDGKTVIVVTHDPEIAAQTKRKIYIKDGLIVSDTKY